MGVVIVLILCSIETAHADYALANGDKPPVVSQSRGLSPYVRDAQSSCPLFNFLGRFSFNHLPLGSVHHLKE